MLIVRQLLFALLEDARAVRLGDQQSANNPDGARECSQKVHHPFTTRGHSHWVIVHVDTFSRKYRARVINIQKPPVIGPSTGPKAGAAANSLKATPRWLAGKRSAITPPVVAVKSGLRWMEMEGYDTRIGERT
jgi:hypothetical protein